MSLSLLAGCGGSGIQFNEVGDLKGFAGGVTSDEPQATLIGRGILSKGGTAADAAAATYMALAVTYPGAASLGGGGACVVYDRVTNKGYALEFLPKSAGRPGAVAVPGNVRGMAALQARFGKLRWTQIVSPAESLAAIGHSMSRATARELAAAGPELLGDAGLATVFRSGAGEPLREGERIRQPMLGDVMSRLRVSDGTDLYTGSFAERFVRDAAAAGGTITVEDMRAYAAVWSDPQSFEYDNIKMLMPPSVGAAAILRRLWETGVRGPGILDTRGTYDRARLAAALDKAYAGANTGAPAGSTAATGFAAIDQYGNGVACAVSMLRPFGLRKLGQQSGILMAPDPSSAPDEMAAFTPIVGANTNVKQVFVAAAGTGGAPAAAALAQVLAGGLVERHQIGTVEAAGRYFRTKTADPMLIENALDPKASDALAKLGIATRASGPFLGRVNAIVCTEGLPRSPDTCGFASDPRGFGLAEGGRTVLP
ncbi:MAG TPA: gamma-glutamyltransferase [Candidatus Cybelea sp.]|nr:gamma-glutamyltransferase [Candidatus Cybelea sp.]